MVPAPASRVIPSDRRRDGDLGDIVKRRVRFYGRIIGSPIEDGSGFIRGRQAIATLVASGGSRSRECRKRYTRCAADGDDGGEAAS